MGIYVDGTTHKSLRGHPLFQQFRGFSYLCSPYKKSMTLYIFNPEHDYALANNDPHFMAPASATKFADDCATFPQYLAADKDVRIFHPYGSPTFAEDLNDIERIVPWGWDRLVRHQLLEAGVSPTLLPTDEQLTLWRDLAHRKIAIAGMDYLREHCPHLRIPESATLLTSTEEVERYIAQHGDVILKSPYSGNGRGNLYAHGEYSPTLRRQTAGVIRKQGSILGEPLHNIVRDFAMEFHCQNGITTFSGYSLFNTKHYGYAGNCLCSDEVIVETLCEWISRNFLEEVKQTLISFVNQNIAPHYDGYLGVDMFVYTDDSGKYQLNPMVEINLRMTMGMAAHILYERYVHPEATGVMQLTFMPAPGALAAWAREQAPLQTLNGRWYSGFHALTPIHEDTQYAVTVQFI